MGGGAGARERTLVVCAAFDAPLGAALEQVRRRLRAAGVRAPAAPRHRPHLTVLGAPCPPGGTAAFADAVARAAAEVPAVDVVLDEAGTFGRGAVLWAGCREPGPLRDWHATASAALASAGLVNTFATAAPGRWVPHCTLARRVRPAAAVAALREHLPVAGRVEALAVVEVGGAGDVALAPLRDRPPG
ncbi:2'-5' RNA ligase family protein [Paenibacillus sp. TRM 82003]|uniref:2'-5' RNA ligase family protein n=1 Tax=Kineococcus sp. TRM81007 TaxID=2925831 RepID=UPI001F574FAD|nr:2'-5' RNA ligase family protein [Kineococcus sp. TRM81007]MCI2238672.1 2'-5' RNA ligase family protein [Kineococcus sp. TRM81007]MCI3927334.1 2'-5' RNA ligase family protein [Paenibacillus sp. TRM 82003]